MTSMRRVHKTPEALHRFRLVSRRKRRAVYVRARYTVEHVGLSIAPKRDGPLRRFLHSLYRRTSSIRSFRDSPDALQHFWVGSPRKREIHQKSNFRQSLEGSKFFWGTKFKNPSQPPCAAIIQLRMCKNAGRHYATPSPCDRFSGSA